MHQDAIIQSEKLLDTCLSALKGRWAKQRQNAAFLRLHERNTAEYEALLSQPCSAAAVRQAWQLSRFISSFQFGAGGTLEDALAGGDVERLITLVDRRIALGNAVIEDTGIFVGRYPEALLQWLLLVSLGRKEDSARWGRFLFESREGSAVDLDSTGLPLDEFCRFLWCSLNGKAPGIEFRGLKDYSGLVGVWDRREEVVGEIWHLMDRHLMDVRKLEGAEVFFSSPFCLCPVEVCAALRILDDKDVVHKVSGHPLYRNPVVPAVMASKGVTQEGLRLRDWLRC